MKFQIIERLMTGRNGDRDTGLGIPYSDYYVYAINENGETEHLKSFGGYDYWWSSPHNPAEIRKVAFDYAEKKAKFFHGQVDHKD